MFNFLVRHFLGGLLFVVPAALTVYTLYVVFVNVDGWINVEPLLNRSIPGAGFVLTIALITLVGFLASNFATRWLFRRFDLLFRRLPLVKLLYTSLRDLIGAFVGERKRFDKPVLVSLGAARDVAVLGFLTRENLSEAGMGGHVTVYVPQSYNFAGNLLVLPRERVTLLDVDSTQAMAFVVSGGVSGSLRPGEAPPATVPARSPGTS